MQHQRGSASQACLEECAGTDHLIVCVWFASCAWARCDAPCSCVRQATGLRFGVVHALPMKDSKLEDALQHVIHSIIQLQHVKQQVCALRSCACTAHENTARAAKREPGGVHACAIRPNGHCCCEGASAIYQCHSGGMRGGAVLIGACIHPLTFHSNTLERACNLLCCCWVMQHRSLQQIRDCLQHNKHSACGAAVQTSGACIDILHPHNTTHSASCCCCCCHELRDCKQMCGDALSLEHACGPQPPHLEAILRDRRRLSCVAVITSGAAVVGDSDVLSQHAHVVECCKG
jgi:hypothetical protein